MILRRIITYLLLLPSIIFTSDDYSENLSINTGETVTFICDLPEKYSNKPVDFYGPGGRFLITNTGENILDDDHRRYKLEHTYAWTWSLIVSDVSEDDAGEYTCRISSDDRTLTIIKRFNLTILTPPKIVDITIESNNNNGIFMENEQVILKCLARGNPQPTIRWNITEKKSFNYRNIITYGNKLLIKNLSRTTLRNFQCIADNGIPPRDTRTRHLVPAIPPEITIQSSLNRFSSQILLNCLVTARPLTSVKWRKNHMEIINNIKRIDINDYTIELRLILPIDFQNFTNVFGIYECEAENQFKLSKAFISVDEFILSNITTRKQQRILSTPSYAQIELLLNDALCVIYSFKLIFVIHILLITYSTCFYNKR